MPTMKKVEIISLMNLILKLPCMTDGTQILCLLVCFISIQQKHLEVSLTADSKRIKKEFEVVSLH